MVKLVKAIFNTFGFSFNLEVKAINNLSFRALVKNLNNKKVMYKILPPFGRLNNKKRGFSYKMEISFAPKLTQNLLL